MAFADNVMVRLAMDASGYVRGARDAANATDKITDSARGSERGLGGLGGAAQKAGQALGGLLAVGAVARGMNAAVNSATNLAESQNAVNVVFKEGAATLHAYGETSATQVGLATSAFNQLATTTGAMLTNFGLSTQQAADETIRLTERAADMASVFNVDVNESLEAVQAALRGESEPIRRFGVSLTEASVAAKAVELGLAATTSEVSESAKAQARLALIYEQTNSVAGDFANTSGGLANQQRILNAELENARAEIGAALVPAWSEMVGVVRDNIDGITSAGEALAGVVQAAGPLVNLLARGLGPALEGVAKYLNLVAAGGEAIGVLLGDDASKGAWAFRQAMDGVLRASENGKQSAAEYANGLVHLATSGALTADRITALGDAAEFTGAQKLNAMQQALDYAGGLDIAEGSLDALSDALTAEALAMYEADAITQEQLESMGLWVQVQHAAEFAAQAATGATEGMGEAVEEAGEATARAVPEVHSLAGALAEARREQEGLTSALLEYANPVAAAARAMDDLATAQAAVDELQAGGKEGTNEWAQAMLDLAIAKGDAQVALDSLSAQGIEDSAESLATLLNVPIEKAEELLEALNLLDGRTFTTVVRVDTIGGPRGGMGSYVGGRHEGGMVIAGQPYLVRPREEVFVPHTTGRVEPVANMSGGRNVQIGPFINPMHADLQAEMAKAELLATNLVMDVEGLRV